MFMFWNVNVYSAPIRVGSLPPWTEKASVGASFRFATGKAEKKSPVAFGVLK